MTTSSLLATERAGYSLPLDSGARKGELAALRWSDVDLGLGHSKIEMTLGIYAHALPSMQQHAAKRLAAMLHR